MSTDTPTPERVTLSAAQKQALHSCPGCGHLIDSHDGSGCSAYNDESFGCTCDADTRTMETTYESVARILAAREQALREEIAKFWRAKREAELRAKAAEAERDAARGALARVEALVSATTVCTSHDLSRADGCDECVKAEGVTEYDLTLRAALAQHAKAEGAGA